MPLAEGSAVYWLLPTAQDYREEVGNGPSPEAKLMNAGEKSILARSCRRSKGWTTCDQLAAAWMLDQLLGNAILPPVGGFSVIVQNGGRGTGLYDSKWGNYEIPGSNEDSKDTNKIN